MPFPQGPRDTDELHRTIRESCMYLDLLGITTPVHVEVPDGVLSAHVPPSGTGLIFTAADLDDVAAMPLDRDAITQLRDQLTAYLERTGH